MGDHRHHHVAIEGHDALVEVHGELKTALLLGETCKLVVSTEHAHIFAADEP